MTTKRILWNNPDGTVSMLVPAPGVPEKVWRKDIPAGVDVVEADAEHLPRDRTFRKAWKLDGGACVECPVKAKEVAHALRRAKRAEEFAPHDSVVAHQLPGLSEQAEAARQRIREKYAHVQTQIDDCRDVAELRQVLQSL